MLPVALATMEPFDKHAAASAGEAVRLIVVPEHGLEGGGVSPPPLLQEIIKELAAISMVANTLIGLFIVLFITNTLIGRFYNNLDIKSKSF